MGNTHTSQAQKSFYDQLTFVRSLDVSKSIMKDPKTQQLYAVVEHTFPSVQQMQKFSQQLQRKKKITHQYYLSPLQQIVLSSSNLCSKQHKVVQIFKWQQYTLMDEIQSRKEEKKQFTDRQIWSILCSCVLTMSYFTKNQITHITLHPKDIVLTSQGQVKILSIELSEYQFDYSYKDGFYYAPETLKAFNSRSIYNLNNKAAVWTLGITLLSVIYVKNMHYLYKQAGIDYNEVKFLVQQIQSSDVKNVLSKMLKQAPYQRISFTQLEEMLYQILENNEALSQTQPQQEEQQIQKLEESIYRLRTQKQVAQPLSISPSKNSGVSLAPLTVDQQDTQNILNSAYITVDEQNMDEQDTQKLRQQTADNSRTGKLSFVDTNGNLRGPLIDKSNSIQISQSLKIVDDKKLDYFVAGLGKTSRQQSSPLYVTEQYSRGRYEGYKQNNMRHGFGTFYYEQGGKYSGQWYKNKMQGRGALYYTNGELAYQGQWNNDQLHGYGVLYNQYPQYTTESIDWKQLDKITMCWVKYEGNFARDMKHGQGTLFLANGQYYRGQFRSDFPNGKGVYRTVANQLIKGSWKNGIFQALQQ